jgi:hypothetical protein
VTYSGPVEVLVTEIEGTGFNETEPVTHMLPVLVIGKLLVTVMYSGVEEVFETVEGKLLVTVTYKAEDETFDTVTVGTGFSETEPVTQMLPVLVTGKLLSEVT